MASEYRPRNPLDMLYQIVGDFWPSDYVPVVREEAEPLPGDSDEHEQAPEIQARPEALAAKPGVPPFEEYWRRCDERVEWTEVLTRPSCPDGLMEPELWRYLHERAERVLAGDISAYAEVLRRVDPLGDLKPYTASVTVSAPDSDRAEVRFEAQPDKLDNPVGKRRLLAGLALRCARDVLALLPVNTVAVDGSTPAGTALSVEYQRDPLRKARFGFIDPVSFAEEMGGVFSDDND